MFSNLANLIRYRGLIQSLVARELKARYRGSVLGFVWSFINPLLLLTIYSFVFSVVLPDLHSKETEPYALFMFCGILPWTWFSSSLTEAAGSLISGGNLIKKVLFPAEVLPIVSVLANMVHFMLGLPILAVFLIYYRRPPDLAGLLWFPVAMLVQLDVHVRARADPVGPRRAFSRHPRHPVESADALVLLDADHLLDQRSARPRQAGARFQPDDAPDRVLSGDPLLRRPGRPLEVAAARSARLSVLLFLAGYWLFDRLRDSFAEAV